MPANDSDLCIPLYLRFRWFQSFARRNTVRLACPPMNQGAIQLQDHQRDPLRRMAGAPPHRVPQAPEVDVGPGTSFRLAAEFSKLECRCCGNVAAIGQAQDGKGGQNSGADIFSPRRQSVRGRSYTIASRPARPRCGQPFGEVEFRVLSAHV